MPRDYYTGTRRYYLDNIAADYRDGWITFGCIPAPGCRDKDGYGKVELWQDGNRQHHKAHAYTLRQAVGDPPPDKPEAAHTCRSRGCVNPAHLSFKSRAENDADKLRDGTTARGDRNGKAKLDDDKVREMIKLSADGWNNVQLGERYGVTESTVRKILSGEIWSHIER